MENTEPKSIVNVFHLYDDTKGHHCRFCKSKKNESYSFGFDTNYLTPELYEDMMFTGWRRCGDYVYKPNSFKSCCKLYSCRLDIDQFVMNKNQRKVMKNFRRFLAGEDLQKKGNASLKIQAEIEKPNLNDPYSEDITSLVSDFLKSDAIVSIYNITNMDLAQSKLKSNNKETFGDYSSNCFIIIYHWLLKNIPDFKNQFPKIDSFSKVIMELYLHFHSMNNIDSHYTVSLSEKTGHLNFFVVNREEYLKFKSSYFQRKSELKEKSSNTKVKSSQSDKSYNFDECITVPEGVKDLKHTYTVELDSPQITNEKFVVFKKYQMKVHGDKEIELTQEIYRQSWECSNLKDGRKLKVNEDTRLKSIYPTQLGTYNFIHRIDGKIIAVGVCDILPTSLSSVYLYYDPDYSFLNLGTFTAIREIEYMKGLKKNVDERFQYYVIGFYGHSCQKLKYKGNYYPTELLDPITLSFTAMSQAETSLNEGRVALLSNVAKNKDFFLTEKEEDELLNAIDVDFNGYIVSVKDFVYSFINPSYQQIIFTSVKALAHNLGKKNLMRLKLIAT